MDRFKFRLWDKEKEVFIDEYLDREIVLSLDGDVYAIANDYEDSINIYGINKDNKFIIEQCTGLRDLSDRLIYEGDILEFDISNPRNGGHYKGFVNYEVGNNEMIGWWINDLKNYGAWDIRQIASPTSPYVWGKIIGNIHENSELLEFNINE